MNNLLYKLQQMIADLAKAEEAENLGNENLGNENLDKGTLYAAGSCGLPTAAAPTIAGCQCNTTAAKPLTCKDGLGQVIDCTVSTNAGVYGCFPLTECASETPPAGCKICDITPTNPTPPKGCPASPTTPTTPTTTTACPTDLTAAASVIGCECIATPTSNNCKTVNCTTTPAADGCTPIDCKVRPDYYGCASTETTNPTTDGGSCNTGNCTADSGCKFMYVDKDCQYGQFDLLAYIKSNSNTILNLDLITANFTDIDLVANKTIIALQTKIDELALRLDGCCSATGTAGGCEYIAYDGVFVDILPANIKVQKGSVDATGNCTIPDYVNPGLPANDNNAIRFLLSPDTETGIYKIEQVPSLGEI